MAKLTVKAVEAAKPKRDKKTNELIRTEIPDGLIGGLYLVVQPDSGAKSWAYRYRFGGKTRKLTLGRYPKIALAGARKLAQGAELQIQQGKDPAIKAPKREEKTVEALCRDFISIYAKEHARPRSLHEMARILGLEFDNGGGLRPTKTGGEVLSRWKGRAVQSIASEERHRPDRHHRCQGRPYCGKPGAHRFAIHVWLGSKQEVPEGIALRRIEAAVQGEGTAKGVAPGRASGRVEGF